MSRSLMPLTAVELCASDLDHPEGVAWGADGRLYAGGEAGQVYRIDPHSGHAQAFAHTEGFVLGLCLDRRGHVYACDERHAAVMRIAPEGGVTKFADGLPVRRMITPNYPAFDAQGNLYVSDSGGWEEDNGTIYVIRPDGSVRVGPERNLPFPNGLALHPNGVDLYVVLSLWPGIGKTRLDAAAGIGTVERVLELPRTVPDGLAFDRDGQLYVACYTPDRIYRFDPASGAVAIALDDWQHTTLCAPTNIAFGGPDLSTLFIASLGGRNVMRVSMPVPGQALAYPDPGLGQAYA